MTSLFFAEAPRDNFKFGGNFNYFTLCLTDNWTMTGFTLPPKLLGKVNF